MEFDTLTVPIPNHPSGGLHWGTIPVSASSLVTWSDGSTTYRWRGKDQIDWAGEKTATVSNGRITLPDGSSFRKPTSYARKAYRFSYRPGTLTQHGGGWSETYEGFIDYYNSALDVSLGAFAFGGLNTDENRRAVVECLLKLGGNKPQLGTFAMEAKQSAEMLADTGVNLLELLRHVKRGNIGALPRDFRTIRRAAGDFWLQWNYGWKPLCSDLHSIYTDLVSKKPERPLISAERNINHTHDFNRTGSYGEIIKIKTKVTDSCKLWAVIDNSLDFGSNAYGLTNPLSLGWEIIPFSFVVDWFMPIGNVLQALSATSGLRFIAGYHSTRAKTHSTRPGQVGTCEAKLSAFTREAYNNFPRPMPYAVRNPISPARTATVLSLLQQLRA